MTPEQEALIRKLDQGSEYVARNTIAGLRRLMLTEIDRLRAQKADMEKRIAELEAQVTNQISTIEGLKHMDAMTCGCKYNKVWMGTKWEHYFVGCKEHGKDKIAELEAELAHVKQQCEVGWAQEAQQRNLAEHFKAELNLRNQELRALKFTIIVTIGGTDYEGFPTSEINYLQRLRILVEKEAELAKEREKTRELLEACQARLKHGHNDTCALMMHTHPECTCGHLALVNAIAKAGEKGD
jgi:uncharacterized coiled-coil protein SlyX